MISFRNDILPLKDELYRLALRITLDSAESEDIVQETLIRVWNMRDKWETLDTVKAQCFTICRNLAIDYERTMTSKEVSIEQTQTESPDTNNSPSQQAINNDLIAIVRKIINTLPEKQRSCIQLRDFEGKSYKDIATFLDISEDQVKVNIFRARNTIKEKFEILNRFRSPNT